MDDTRFASIEHLDPGVLGLFPTVVFGFYAPRVAVVTTPNAEFNVNFPNLGYGTPDAVLRDADHRFEWTRAEFQEWAAMCAGEFGYSVEFHGIGRLPPSDNPAPDTSDTGACTQAAVFTRHDDPASIKMRSDALVGWLDPNEDPYELQLFSTTEFPYFEQDGFSDDVIVAELRHCVEYAVRLAPDKAGSAIPAGTVVPLDHIWDLLQIRQLCKRLPRLVEALESPAAGEYFALTKDPDEVEILFEIAAKEMPDHTHDDVGYTSEETEHASDSDQQTDHSSDGGGSKLKVQSGHGALPAPSARENVPVAPQDNWGTTFEVDTSLENGW
nr:Small RNA 2'-O-methyltransferase [Polyrhizophydium stewartii]